MKDKDGLKYLYVATASIAFFVAGIPILESFGTLVSNVFGLQSVKLSTKANKIAGENGESVQENTNVIGFQVPSEEGECYDE